MKKESEAVLTTLCDLGHKTTVSWRQALLQAILDSYAAECVEPPTEFNAYVAAVGHETRIMQSMTREQPDFEMTHPAVDGPITVRRLGDEYVATTRSGERLVSLWHCNTSLTVLSRVYAAITRKLS